MYYSMERYAVKHTPTIKVMRPSTGPSRTQPLLKFGDERALIIGMSWAELEELQDVISDALYRHDHQPGEETIITEPLFKDADA